MARPTRPLIRKLGPGWLVKDEVQPDPTAPPIETDSRVLYSLAGVGDAMLERTRLGVRARFPGGGAPADALPYIGRDRLIIRGPDEAQAAYELRLQRYLDDHRVRGNPWALMEQIRGYCSPHAVKVRTVDEHGNWRFIDSDGTRSRSLGDDWDWDGSALADTWGRFWLIIEPAGGTLPWAPGPDIGDVDLWDGAIGTPGFTIGTTATPNDVASVRSIVKAWKRAGVKCVHVIVSFRSSQFVPSSSDNPDGSPSWANYSINSGGTQVAVRDPWGRYWLGP